MIILNEFGNSTVTATVTRTSTSIVTKLINGTSISTFTTTTQKVPSADSLLLPFTVVAVLIGAMVLLALYKKKAK